MKKTNLILVSLVVLTGLIGFLSAHMGESHGGVMYGSYWGIGMFSGWIFGILVVVALILLIVWLMKQIQSPSRRR